IGVPQEWLLWMTKTTSRFKYRINPDVVLTFQIRAPEEPPRKSSCKPAPEPTPEATPEATSEHTPEPTLEPISVQPARLKRPPGRPRKIIADVDPNVEYRAEDDEVQPAKPKRGRGRLRKVIVNADSDADNRKENQEHDDMVEVGTSGHLEEIDLGFVAENEENYEMSVILSVEQDD
ncbi:hypothetical protein QBC32DRAFT_211637, partial [Pseudoneurospora amorphoporcata]